MQTIKTIDLWTEQYTNHYECFNGAFVDGFEQGGLPYTSYKIIKNCNCIINNSANLPIGNKHQAIVFYKKNIPVRLIVLGKDTNIDELLINAMNQKVGDNVLGKLLKKYNVTSTEVDLNEKPVFNEYNLVKEIDTGSCDRLSLLKTMLSGSYTEDDTVFGHYDSDRYFYIKNLTVSYKLKTDNEYFEINHNGGFINDLKSSVIILQTEFSGK